MGEREYRPKKRSSDFTDESTSSYAKYEPSKPSYDDDEYISDERLDEIMREENFMFAMAGVEPNEHRLGLSHEAELDRIFASGIPIAIVTTYGTSIGSKAIWQTLGQVIARHFGQKAAIALGLTVGDGPLPVADAFAMGLMVVAAWQIARQWDELWAEVEQELANSEIVVTQEPENQVYTTPNEEIGGIEHTGSVPPQVETGTPPFDTEAGRDIVEGSNNTGDQTQQEVNWDNYIFESQVDQDFNDPRVRRRDEIAHSGYYSRKNLRKKFQEASISTHDRKHLKAKTEEEARQLSHKQAQYLPGINNGALEREALLNGEHLLERDGGAFWNFYRSDDYIGYDQGVKTRWIRAEYSSQTIHGHPMNPKRLSKYVKNPTP